MQAAELAAAAERRDYAAVSASAIRYRELLEQAVRDLPPPETAAQFGDAAIRIETARRCIAAARAHIAERLGRLQRAARYGRPPEPSVHLWSVRA
jgi:hypothetical protein